VDDVCRLVCHLWRSLYQPVCRTAASLSEAQQRLRLPGMQQDARRAGWRATEIAHLLRREMGLRVCHLPQQHAYVDTTFSDSDGNEAAGVMKYVHAIERIGLPINVL